jgi:hypothetical protein
MKPPSTLDTWLTVALRGVALPDQANVREEITAHYQDAFDWHRKTKPQAEAQQLAVQDLGDAVVAGRGYFLGYFDEQSRSFVRHWIKPPPLWEWSTAPLMLAVGLLAPVLLQNLSGLANLPTQWPQMVIAISGGAIVVFLLTLFRTCAARSNHYKALALTSGFITRYAIVSAMAVSQMIVGNWIIMISQLIFSIGFVKIIDVLSSKNTPYARALAALRVWPQVLSQKNAIASVINSSDQAANQTHPYIKGWKRP